MRPRTPLALLAAAALAGCTRSEPPPAPERIAASAAPEPAAAATSQPAPDAAAASTGAIAESAPPAPSPPAAAPPPLPATSILRSAAALETGQRLALAPGAEVVVDPQATFEVELVGRAPDARLVLVDARDDIVAANGTRDLSTITRLTLAPATPLVPGSRYALRLDGASQRELHDESGRAFSALTFPVLAAGTPPPPEPKRPAPKKRAKRRN